MEKRYDIIIIGSGPAGMTAGIYGQRAGMKCLTLEKMAVGGQVASTPHIENYPGYPAISGVELSEKMFEQDKLLGMNFEFEEAQKIETQGKIKKVKAGNVTYTAPAIILSMGASSRSLGVEGDKNYIGRGVSYCATCDGAFFRNKVVAVVGGGNTAFEDIEYLSSIVKKIIHIHRRSEFRADGVNIQSYNNLVKEKDSKIESYLGYVVEKLNGENRLESIEIKNIETNEKQTLKLDGLFVAIGRVPQTEILDKELKLDENGYIVVNEKMETSIEGVFACGDITHKMLRQISTATGDGAIAGTSASIYVKKQK